MKTRGAYAGNDNNLVRLNTYCLSGQNEMLDVNDKRFLKSGFKKKILHIFQMLTKNKTR
jgi:hypothetical protein